MSLLKRCEFYSQRGGGQREKFLSGALFCHSEPRSGEEPAFSWPCGPRHSGITVESTPLGAEILAEDDKALYSIAKRNLLILVILVAMRSQNTITEDLTRTKPKPSFQPSQNQRDVNFKTLTLVLRD